MEKEKKREMTHNRKTRGSKPHPTKLAGETLAVQVFQGMAARNFLLDECFSSVLIRVVTSWPTFSESR